MGTSAIPVIKGRAPFDSKKLDAYLENAGLDVILISSRHNLRYLLGGYTFFFFDYFEAFGTSKYFPLMVYFRGQPEKTAYIGHGMESFELELDKFWMSEVSTRAWGIQDSLTYAVQYIRDLAPDLKTIGVEPDFIPFEAAMSLQKHLPGTELVNCQRPLELLRSIKTSTELALIKKASDDVVESMLAVVANSGPGITKNELVAKLAAEEEKRGLSYEYCLITAGTSLNRAPSDYVLKKGDIVSIDSGGQLQGYIGDLCRMAIIGEPDAEQQDLLAEIDAIQTAARNAIKAGNLGREIYTAANQQIALSPNAKYVDFVAHGLGLVTHETPRLAPSGFPYEPTDAERPLEKGMVISVETAIKHPRVGFIKLEDTLAIEHDGSVAAYGDFGRGWTRFGR
ncbi:M24 family metallopeptidase [Pantoea cypripedii]|uniref:Aminopeptidase P family protein n=1 Tax=Pantoea cypripedii TaxID=55209 RepID=A0A6B9GF63_PANCY|nr:Xaa-Pro peptidase family protein [Pantoea cypripedii]QGY32967.1 aminopeptidase P family protein [Pantoea cypripedii]